TLVAGPETKRYRAAKFLARNRGAVAGAVVVAVALIVGLVVSLAALRSARKAEAGERIAKNEALEAGRKTEKSLRDVLRLTSEAGDPKRMLELLDQAISDGVGDEVELRLYRVAALDAAYRPMEASQELALLEGREDLGDHRGMVLLWRGDLELLGIIGPRTGVNPEERINEAILAGLPPAENAYARGLIARDYDGARAAFEECVRSEPTHLRGQLMLGLVEVLGGEVERGRARAAALAIRAPSNPSPPALEALALMFLGRMDECEPLVRRIGEICGQDQEDLMRWGLRTFDQMRGLFAQGEDTEIGAFVVKAGLRIQQLMNMPASPDELPVRLPAFVSARVNLQEIVGSFIPKGNPGEEAKAETLVSKLTESAPGIRPMFEAIRAMAMNNRAKYAEAEEVATAALDLPAMLNVDTRLLTIAMTSAHQAYIKNGDLEARVRGAAIGRRLPKVWEPTNAGDWALARRVAECGEVAIARMMLEALEQRHMKSKRALGPIIATRVVVEYLDGNDIGVLRHVLRIRSIKVMAGIDAAELRGVVEGALARCGPSLATASPPIDAEAVRKHVGLNASAQQPPPK
ncbi:MAG: hypothetical protein IT438_14780, partial [Phycisphaerales bacterium]|nr:hypothetical protein [Phycisphaerales bacterium]